jgi:hypothetical protein
VRTKAESPLDYAATQLSRGEAFLQLVITGVEAACSLLDEVRACFKEAGDGFTQSGRMERADAVKKRLALIADALARWAALVREMQPPPEVGHVG